MKNMLKTSIIVLSVISILSFVVVAAITGNQVVNAAPRVQWVSECFNTYRGMIAGANASGSEDVQFFSIPSERNFAKLLGDPYCIIYKK